MRKFFNHKAIEGNLGVIAIIAAPGVFMLASAFAPAAMKPQNKNVPAWVNDFDARPNGLVCKIKDIKTGREFVSEEGKKIPMPRGFSVASSPSSCNVTAPDKETCQLRGWPIEPIC